MIMAEAPRCMDVWVLEHTTRASGVRVHHASGSWILFPNTPAGVSSSPMLAQAGHWLWAIKRRELVKRQRLSALRQSLAQGPEALEQALASMAWDWSAVMDVIDAIDAITHPVDPYFAPDSPWYSSAPERQKAWLGTEGTFEGFHQWLEFFPFTRCACSRQAPQGSRSIHGSRAFRSPGTEPGDILASCLAEKRSCLRVR